MTELLPAQLLHGTAPHKDSGELPASPAAPHQQQQRRATTLHAAAGAMCRSSAATYMDKEVSISISRRRPGASSGSHSQALQQQQQQAFVDSQESNPAAGFRKRKASMVQDPICQLINVKRVSGQGPAVLAMSTAPA